MNTRLYCRECGWSHAYQRKCAALRAAARHTCATTQTSPRWWTRLWTRLHTGSPPHLDAEIPPNTRTDLVTIGGNRNQLDVLAAHHAETTRRARHALAELVRAGYQIGPPPYGYRTMRIRITDPTGHSKLRTILVPEWHTAAVVAQIFYWRAEQRLSFTAIARRLNSDPPRYPTPTQFGRWNAEAVKRITTNPKYTGRQVWARTIAGRPAPSRAVGHLRADGAPAVNRPTHLPPRPVSGAGRKRTSSQGNAPCSLI
jgi:hypothetical protein